MAYAPDDNMQLSFDQSLFSPEVAPQDEPSAVPVYTIIRSKRRTLALHIDNDAHVIVRAPLKASERHIEAFVVEHSSWIEKKQQQALSAKARYEPIRIEEGALLPYLGKKYSMAFVDVASIKISGNALLLPVGTNEEALVRWLKRQAKALLFERVQRYSTLMGTPYASIKLSGARKRWGSCSATNNLNFAWRLIMCTPEAIDYVVVHELCHVEHKDHSKRFWAKVKLVLPNYKQRRQWLKDNRSILDLL